MSQWKRDIVAGGGSILLCCRKISNQYFGSMDDFPTSFSRSRWFHSISPEEKLRLHWAFSSRNEAQDKTSPPPPCASPPLRSSARTIVAGRGDSKFWQHFQQRQYQSFANHRTAIVSSLLFGAGQYPLDLESLRDSPNPLAVCPPTSNILSIPRLIWIFLFPILEPPSKGLEARKQHGSRSSG